MTTGRFITLEGIEGAGKTTQLAALRAHLEAAGRSVCVTREPGGTALGERLRALLLDPALTITAPAELCLMFAARAEHVASVVRPALAAGTWVLCDRYVDASYAYQGAGRGLGEGVVAALETALALPVPDRTLLLDLAPAQGRARAAGRAAADRFEREGDAFFARARAAYLARAAAEPGRFRVVDASRPQAEVAAALIHALADLA